MMRLVLFDTSALIYRAYFAIPPLLRASDGLQINAVYGVCQSLWYLLRKLEPPSHMAAILDRSRKTFRHEIYPAYKANRSQRPSPLATQIPIVREAIEAFGIPTIDAINYEADDLIATYAREASARGMPTLIVSPDKDLLQLVNANVLIWNEGEKIDGYSIRKSYGIPPSKFADLQALMGDTSDNIPGISGIGPKRAAALLNEFGDLEGVLAMARSRPGKFNRHITSEAENARLSKKLVTLADVPLEIPLDWLGRRECDYAALVAFLEKYECPSLARRVSEFAGLGVL